MLQEPFGEGPTAVQRPHQVFLGNLHIREERLAKRRRAVDQEDRSGLYAWRRHIDQQKADPFVLLALVCTDKTEAPVGQMRARGPDLLTVDQPVVTLVLGARLQARQV